MTRLFRSFDFSIYIFGGGYFIIPLSLFLFTFYFYYCKYYYFLSYCYLFVLDIINRLSSGMFSKSFTYLFWVVFFFIFSQNFCSIFPYCFPTSSHFCFVLLLSLSLWLIINIFRILNSFVSIIIHYVPSGTPMFLVFLMFIIEVVSNIIRPVTLSVRLVANILSGHLLITLLFLLVRSFSVVGILCFIVYVVLTLVELFVSLVQSYIFCTLSSLYYFEVFKWIFPVLIIMFFYLLVLGLWFLEFFV